MFGCKKTQWLLVESNTTFFNPNITFLVEFGLNSEIYNKTKNGAERSVKKCNIIIGRNAGNKFAVWLLSSMLLRSPYSWTGSGRW